jgi:hypothetical protein
LLPGSYHISAKVQNRHSGLVYDGGHRIAYFDVVPGESQLDSFGYFGLGGTWERVDG